MAKLVQRLRGESSLSASVDDLGVALLNASREEDEKQAKREVENLKCRRLLGLDLSESSSLWRDPRQLRRIFRLFDTDNDGVITALQFKQGLEHLEFEVSNMIALNDLVAELDTEHQGTISRDAFLGVFRDMSRQMLQARLANQSSQQLIARRELVKITVLDRYLLNHSWKSSLTELEPSMWEATLATPPAHSKCVRWIDVKGYDGTLLETLGRVLRLPASVVADMGIQQRAKVEFYPETEDNPVSLQVVCHVLSLANCPIVAQQQLKLKPGAVYNVNRPVVRSSQIHFVVLGDRTLLSYRAEQKDPELDNLWAILWPQLERQTTGSKGAVSLLSELLDEVAEHNWVARDLFKDWEKTLEESIRMETRKSHPLHLLDLQHTALVASNILTGNMLMMKQLTDEEFRGSDRVKFIAAFLDDYKDIFENFSRLSDEAVLTTASTNQLQTFYKTRQNEQMNSILMTLTRLSTMVLPLQLLTGTFGMNFEYMPELAWEWSYPCFWLVVVTYVTMSYLWLRYKHGFSLFWE